MCHLCHTRKTIERLERQIKNIDDGGAISPSALRQVLDAARADLARHVEAMYVSALVLNGMAKTAIAMPLPDAEEEASDCVAPEGPLH